MASPSDLQPILRCPYCRDALDAPATLRCGHSVCARHIHPTNPRCPLPACRVAPAVAVRVPEHIAYSAPSTLAPFPSLVTAAARDVSLNKVLALVARTQERLNDPPPRPADDDDGEDDGDRPRPRKRMRRAEPDDEPDLLAHLISQSALQRTADPDEPLPSDTGRRDAILSEFDKELCQELSCDICSNVYYQPVTTPCQHTYCAKCLQRSLDHHTTCPLCRENLPNYSYFQDHPINNTIYQLILKAFPGVYEARKEAIEQEERDAELDTPIFVAMLVFPGQPVTLHIFEPRYRLMLRRCLDSNRPRFGMVMPPSPNSPSPLQDFGTMLEITSVKMLDDGRSLVQTEGTFRFRVVARGSLDGYTVAKIDRIDDHPDTLINRVETSLQQRIPQPSRSASQPSSSSPKETTPPAPPSSDSSQTPSSSTSNNLLYPTQALPRQRPNNDELIAICHRFIAHIRRGAAPWIVQRLNDLPPMPDDPSAFSFWVVHVIPLDDLEKAKLLLLQSPRLRLLLVVHWIEQLNRNWYVRMLIFSGYLRWVVWAAIETVIGVVLWLLKAVLRLSIVGAEPDSRAVNAALRGALLGAAFPVFLVCVAMWWAV
ncbi:PUA-like domain-containing protein [Ephemerocybe angulata]|uniref:PUA-like domain-containing protein n=1 Tax=Ephemerocybe angulata TaxID=980116 RepID=A0A8H6IAX4_9AGAR|nr:PUA-like domain-containing protein [Tulosesus angulatus]